MLTQDQIPSHTHTATASGNAASTADPTDAYWANGGKTAYGSSANAQMAGSALGTVGGQPHDNMQPYLVLNYCIALQGIFPSRN